MSHLSREQESIVESLLQEIDNTEPVEIVARVPDPLSAQVLIERLPLRDGSPIPLLLAMKEGFKDKGVEKEIKRALFKLKKKGINTQEVDEKEGVSSSILRPPKRESPVAYVGPISWAMGFRAVVVILHRGGKGLDIGFGLVSDEEGFREFLYHNVSKKGAYELKERFSQEAGPLVKTSPSHTTAILEGAYRMHLALKSEAPSDYLKLRPWLLENAPALDRPVIYDLIPETSISKTTPSDLLLKGLFNHELMASWLIEPDTLLPFMTDMAKVQDSPIVLTEIQKFARISEIKGQCMDEIFSIPKRELLKRRLEEMSYIFYRSGQEETAGLALTAAQAANQEVGILKTNPVIEAFLERSLALYSAAAEKSASEQDRETSETSSLILP